MKKLGILLLSSSLLFLASFPALAQVSLSVDSATTTSSTSFPGSPALGLNPPNSGNAINGGTTDGIIFNPTTSFTLGAIELNVKSGGAGADSIGTYNLFFYDLGTTPFSGGTSSTIPIGGSASVYTFNGSEANLFDAGLNFTTTAADVGQFDVLTFSGDDEVALNAGDYYVMVFTEAAGTTETLDLERGSSTSANPNFLTQAMTTSSSVYSPSDITLDNINSGQRDALGAIYAASPVPEPSAPALAGLTVAVFGTICRFKK